MQAIWGKKQSLQLRGEARLLLTRQSLTEETRRAAGRGPCPHMVDRSTTASPVHAPNHCPALAMSTDSGAYRAVSPRWGLVCLNLLQLCVDLRQPGTFRPFSPGAGQRGVCGTDQGEGLSARGGG